jgi:polyhydroxyalkanoate synthase
MTDMMAWNADSTRLPYRMHSEYLRRLYLDNELAEGRYKVDGRPITIPDIRQPLFCVGTLSDHVAPWRSVYKWTQLADTEVTFALTTGGHNAGIVSEPGHGNRSYRIATHHEADMHPDAETWMAEVPVREGSWWPAWVEWLAARSGQPVRPPPMGSPACGYAPVCDAPGQYVLEA